MQFNAMTCMCSIKHVCSGVRDPASTEDKTERTTEAKASKRTWHIIAGFLQLRVLTMHTSQWFQTIKKYVRGSL